MGWSERLRQIMQRPAQGQARTNIKRQQLREDRTKAFLMLAGSTVVLGLMFFALFSSPSSSHKDNSARPNQPNLGRGPGGEGADTSRSVTPLLNADTRNPNEDPGKLNPQDIQNTARARMSAETSVPPSSPPPQPAVMPPPRDYALNRIQFPAEPEPVAVPAAVPAGPKVDKLTSASLVFVSAGAGTGTREKLAAGGNMQPALVEPQFSVLPPGTRLVARLQTPVSSAVKTPIVAAIEYNYERDGEIVIPPVPRLLVNSISRTIKATSESDLTAFSCRMARISQSTAALWVSITSLFRGRSPAGTRGRSFWFEV